MNSAPAGGPGSTRTRGAATIERALAAAREIIDEGGETSLRIVDVSQRSHVSIGSLYHHFGSRDGLVDAAREQEFHEALASDTWKDEAHFTGSATIGEFIERVDEVLCRSDDPRWATVRGRRFEIIGSIAARPGSLTGVVDLHITHIDAIERIASAVHDRGWLARGIEPRAFALFMHAVSMSRVLRDVDDQVSNVEWRRVVRASLLGLMPDAEVSSCCGNGPKR